MPDLETAIAWLLASADPSDEASELLRRLLALTAEPTWLASCLPSATWLAAHVAPLVEAPRALPLVATGLAEATAAKRIVRSEAVAAVAMRWQRGGAELRAFGRSATCVLQVFNRCLYRFFNKFFKVFRDFLGAFHGVSRCFLAFCAWFLS